MFKPGRLISVLSGLLRLFCLVSGMMIYSGAFAAWQPIVGIPEPSFGVNEMAPARPNPWTSDVAGFYYVDADTGDDTGNPNGNPTNPRRTVPNPIPAGSYVEVHGNFTSNVTITAQGTASNPVFVRGESTSIRPTFGRFVNITNSTYLIMEFLKTEPETSSLGSGSSGIHIQEGSSFITLRHSEISGLNNLNKTGTLGVGTFQYSGTETANNILLDNLDLHDIGDVNATVDQDGHCIAVNGDVTDLWIVNSTFARCSGDGVQLEAFHTQGGQFDIQRVYIGNNTSTQHKQSGFWVKHARDVIISSNDMFNFVRSDSSSGQCTGHQYTADYVWWINNKIHDCEQGIIVGSSDSNASFDHSTEGQGGAFYIGNQIYDIVSQFPTNTSQAGGIVIRNGEVSYQIVNNTFVNTDIGISAPMQSGFIDMYNNVFYNSGTGTGNTIHLENVSSNSRVDDSLFFDTGGATAMLRFGNPRTIATLQAASPDVFGIGVQCLNCKEADPLFVDVANKDFRIQGFSPARNSAVLQSVYQTFQTRYGFSIEQDLNGIARPAGTAWDMGALEADEDQRPVAPTGVTATTVP